MMAVNREVRGLVVTKDCFDQPTTAVFEAQGQIEHRMDASVITTRTRGVSKAPGSDHCVRVLDLFGYNYPAVAAMS